MPKNTDDSTIVEFEYESQKIQIEGYHKDDLIFNKIKRSKSFYELKLLEKARQYNLSGVYIDIGANIGNHAIFFNKFCPASKVYCFEIEKSIFKILNRNMERNCAENSFHLSNVGISDESGFVDLCQVDHNNCGITKIVNNDGTQCIVDTLDNLVEGIENISLIKIDVEGFELQVIKGATKILINQSPIIFVELQSEQDFSIFNEFISLFGYSTDKTNYAGTPTYLFEKMHQYCLELNNPLSIWLE